MKITYSLKFNCIKLFTFPHLNLFHFLLFFCFSGNYFLRDDSTVVIHKHHIYRALERGTSFEWSHTPVWTFNATNYFKIRFHFTDFDCLGSASCYVRIGNGLISEEDRLLNYNGRSVPSNVTSESNTAWLKVYAYRDPP